LTNAAGGVNILEHRPMNSCFNCFALLLGVLLAGAIARAEDVEGSKPVAASTPASIDATTKPAVRPAIDLSAAWTALQEGETEGTVEQDAHHASSTSPHLLRIEVTKTAAPGLGRVGAKSDIPVAVREGQWFDVRFAAMTEGPSVGLVFSLEGADGKLLARTTLPEIGRGRAGRAATAPAPTWRKYLVALHARADDPKAHLVITPIEPTNIWLDELTMTPR
jgi:hypothetical protein